MSPPASSPVRLSETFPARGGTTYRVSTQASPKKGMAPGFRKRGETMARPRKAARWSGSPKRVSLIRSAASVRAWRANRLSHDKREGARRTREIVGGEEAEVRESAGSIRRSRCWRCRRRQARQRSGAEPTSREWSRTRIWRGLPVVRPFPWHCPRFEHGRQSPMLAEETIRRRPSCSRRCSWGTRTLPAGQRRVPSDWRGSPFP